MSKRILVVDDDMSFVRLVERILQGAGYEVNIATNGLNALKIVRDKNPDLVLLDIMLPGVDGFEICRRLRDAPDTAQMPILMGSSKSRKSDREMAIEVGANDFYAKPIKSEELLDMVENLLGLRSSTNDRESVRQSAQDFLGDDNISPSRKGDLGDQRG